jgi:predicted nuclease of restriction endonuclease-like (RecB) superfamily
MPNYLIENESRFETHAWIFFFRTSLRLKKRNKKRCKRFPVSDKKNYFWIFFNQLKFKEMPSFSDDESYQSLFQEIAQMIQAAQAKAVLSVNQELLFLHWNIGHKILERQAQANWGDKVVKQLSNDLQQQLPRSKGFSYRNLQYMKRFAVEVSREAIVQVPLAQLSWYHHLTLIEKVSDPLLRLWYAQKPLKTAGRGI